MTPEFPDVGAPVVFMCCQTDAAIPFPLFIGVQAVIVCTMLDGHPAGSSFSYRQRFGRVLCSMTVCSVF